MAGQLSPAPSAIVDDLRSDDPEMQRRITEAAEECFRRFGIRRTRMDDVAAKVGLARPNLYRFVPNKDALIRLVILKHSAAVDAERRRQIPIQGPVGELIVRSLVMGVMMSRQDEFDMDLLHAANIDAPSRLLNLSQGDDPVLPRPAYWYPILDHGRQRSEIREDLTNAQIVRWIGKMTLLFVQWPDMFPDETAVRWHVETFVLPCVLSRPTTRPTNGRGSKHRS